MNNENKERLPILDFLVDNLSVLGVGKKEKISKTSMNLMSSESLYY